MVLSRKFVIIMLALFIVSCGGGGDETPTPPENVNVVIDDDNNVGVVIPDGDNDNIDTDGDGVEDTLDAFPLDNTETIDTDNDGIGNNADTDDDSDGVEDTLDAFPLDKTESTDTDNDGIGNNTDTDDDGDGVEDEHDLFPLNIAESKDFDLDGVGDNEDDDDDNDGVNDDYDTQLLIISTVNGDVNQVTHTLFDPKSNQLFITDKGNKQLKIINVDSHQVVKTIQFDKMPWRMSMSSGGEYLYVALLDREFQYYDSNQGGGTIYALNTKTLTETNRFDIAIDPFDLVVTSSGKVIVSSGSNQWTNINAYNVTDGELLGSTGIRHQSYLSLHPSQDWVFAADTDSYPSDFEKFDISGEGITSLGDSPYHGDYSISGKVWASTDGHYIFTRGGGIFNADDMTYISEVDGINLVEKIIFDEQNNLAFILSDDGELQVVNLNSLQVIETVNTPGDISDLLISDQFVFYFSTINNALSIIKAEHPCADCSESEAPTASFIYTPSFGGTTLDNFEFDASGSTDTENGTELEYRWDFDNDNHWDTDFNSNPAYTHQFILAGTKYVTLQVKNSKGLVNNKTLDIHVIQGIDPGNVVTESEVYSLQFTVTDVVSSPVTNKAYITDKDAKRLYIVNLETGFTEKYFDFSVMPERMAISPDNQTLYVSLLVQEHSSYWWEEDQSGYIATFNLSDETQVNLYEIPTDPYDLVVNSEGKLIVTSGSGQWTDIYALDASDGSILGASGIRQRSTLTLHPSGDYVFAADTDSSPSDFEKFDISGEGIISLGGSPYHGDYSIAGEVWTSPDGQYVISSGGHIFLASDMTYVQTVNNIPNNIEDIAFDSVNDVAFVVDSSGAVYHLNSQSWQLVSELETDGITHVLITDDELLFIDQSSIGTIELVKIAHPCADCGSNTQPVASFFYTPDTDGTTVDTFVFDASASSDAEDGAMLEYRWDFDNDNVWDTDFTSIANTSHEFFISGEQTVVLQVKDSAGLVHTISNTFTVSQGVDFGIDVAESEANVLDFTITDVVNIPTANKAYITDKSAKRLYIVNLETGLTEKYFEFTLMPERMAISPDNQTLYLSLLVQEHSSYWWEEDQSGYIATFNLSDETQVNLYEIPTDPYDLVVNSEDKLIVSSGSGQWTDIYALDASDGSVLGTSSIRQGSPLTLHPSGDYVFAADRGLSPSDFEKFDISGEGIISLGDSPYHGDYNIAGKVWTSPDGKYVISRGGHIFLASDMTYVQTLNNIPNNIEDIVFDSVNDVAFIVDSSGAVYHLNSQSWELVSELETDGITHVLLTDDELLFIDQSSIGSIELDKIAHPCADCGSNSQPVASFFYTPDADGTTVDTFEFDASASSDAEDGAMLEYRWDFENDNVWDTDFTGTANISHEFLTSGEQTVVLQVKDSAGLVHTISETFMVTQGVYFGIDITGSEANVLDFTVTDVVSIPTTNKAYITDKSAKRLYIVNLETGLTEKYFEFTLMPERMAISPDNQTLYLSLLVQDHSSYWWEEDQSGYIATFNLSDETQVNLYEIPTDPYDLVVNSEDKLIVSSGSGQWTDIYALDASDGSVLGTSGIRQRSTLTLHPSGDYVFAADTDSSPSDFEKFDISGEGIISLGDSPYHGSYGIYGKVWITPDGFNVIAKGGDIFLTSDMTHVEKLSLSNSNIGDVAFDEMNEYLYVLANGQIYQFNLDTFEYIQNIDSDGASSIVIVDSEVFGFKAGINSWELLEFTFE